MTQPPSGCPQTPPDLLAARFVERLHRDLKVFRSHLLGQQLRGHQAGPVAAAVAHADVDAVGQEVDGAQVGVQQQVDAGMRRVEALDAFLRTQDGANLLAGYKRAANILAAEEKKGKGLSEADLAAGLDVTKLTESAEKALYAALEQALPAARAAMEKEDFAAAMKALSSLRTPVDAFFDGVLVNAEDVGGDVPRTAHLIARDGRLQIFIGQGLIKEL